MTFKSDSSLKTSEERISKNRNDLAKRKAESKLNSAKAHFEKLPDIHKKQLQAAQENVEKAKGELAEIKAKK